eukprot:2145752-Pyramimonas_sp.AAC.2
MRKRAGFVVDALDVLDQLVNPKRPNLHPACASRAAAASLSNSGRGRWPSGLSRASRTYADA